MKTAKEYITGSHVLINGYVDSARIVQGFERDENVIVGENYKEKKTDGGLIHRMNMVNEVADYRSVFKIPLDAPLEALVLGWSVRLVGEVTFSHTTEQTWAGGGDYEQGYIAVDKRVDVVMVMPLNHSQKNRYRKPIAVLPEQITEMD